DSEATGAAIVAAARSQIGVPYSWGGGGYKGKSKGIGRGNNTVGFDCSGLAQYAVYTGTGKIIARISRQQYKDSQCKRVAYDSREPGDLVFFGSPVHHVAIVINATFMIAAPHTGDYVKEQVIYAEERQPFVRRCFCDCDATGAAIVAAARSQIGVPYSWGGGGYKGKSLGTGSGAHTVGFDCSGLAQYAVYKGTNKIISRTSGLQYTDSHCKREAYANRQPGDLVFFGSPVHHVAIVSSATQMIAAPQTGDHVKEQAIYAAERQPYVERCDCEATGAAIVAAARSQIGVPYSWGGGGYKGKSKGIDQGAHTVGFDCSGLAQYAVYKGTNKIISRTSQLQYKDSHCKRVTYSSRKPGDLVFFGSPPHHVAIVSSATHMIAAPHTGDHVKEQAIYATERQPYVERCY
ncbi:unnamed protein product, partial [Medioppia subpectinata]